MKYVVILPDGAADEPTDRLGGRTPLGVAKLPCMDSVAKRGQVGRVVTVPEGFLPGSDVATLSLFGYDPKTCHTGRAPLEATAKRIQTRPDQTIFRCNLVTIENGRMVDFTAGHLSQPEADQLIVDLNESLGIPDSRFHVGVSYRNLLITSSLSGDELTCTPPHDIPDKPVADHRPQGEGSDLLMTWMERAGGVLAEHEVNRKRRELGQAPATDIWLWGQGKPTVFEPFSSRFGVRGAVIAGVDLIRGLAMCAGLDVLDVMGATGYLDTDYGAKGRVAVDALDTYDLVLVHVEAPDEAGHEGNVDAKVDALEKIDAVIVQPLLERLETFDAWRILIAPDHPTPVDRRIHTMDPPPFCMAGTKVVPDDATVFDESAAASTGLLVDPGCKLMSRFFDLS